MAQLSGKKTVTTAGTAVKLDDDQQGAVFAVKALMANTGNVYIGNDGEDDVASTNGYELAPGEVVVLESPNLNQVWLDAEDGEGVSWLRLER